MLDDEIVFVVVHYLYRCNGRYGHCCYHLDKRDSVVVGDLNLGWGLQMKREELTPCNSITILVFGDNSILYLSRDEYYCRDDHLMDC